MNWSIDDAQSKPFTFSELQNTSRQLTGYHVCNLLRAEIIFNNTINNDDSSNATPSSGDANHNINNDGWIPWRLAHADVKAAFKERA